MESSGKARGAWARSKLFVYQSVVKKRRMAYGSVQARHAILSPLVQLCFVNWHVGSVHRLPIGEIAELI